MPTVAVMEGVKVQFFFDDYPPPHFHAEIGGEVAQIEIGTLSVLRGGLPPTKLRTLIAWAESRRDELLRAWYDTAAGRKPGRLE